MESIIQTKTIYGTVLFLVLASFLLRIDKVYGAYQEKSINIPIKEDTYVEENYPTVAPWNNRNLYLGKDSLYNKGITRIFFKPDLKKLSDVGVSSTDILEAQLRFFQYAYTGNNAFYQLNIYKVNSPWSMYSLNWSNQPLTTYYYYKGLSHENGEKLIPVTTGFVDLYTKFLLDGQDNGFALRMSPETNASVIFWAKDCTLAPNLPRCNSGEEPYVLVKYRTVSDPPSSPELQTPEDNLRTNLKRHNFIARGSVDPNGLDISYRLILCADSLCSIELKKSAWNNEPSFSETVPEGRSYWKIEAKNSYNAVSSSTVRSIEADFTAPPIPSLLPLAPITKGNSIELEWKLDTEEEGVLCQVGWGYGSYTETVWQAERSIILTDVKDGRYYYKVRCKDSFENISNWSKSEYSVQDSTPPNVEYFKSSKSYISPQNRTSLNKSDYSYIQASVSDSALKEITLIIYNSNKEKVYEQKNSESGYIALKWPLDTGNNYAEGTYFMYVASTDLAGNSSISDPIKLVIDDTSPGPVQISGVMDKGLYKEVKSVEISIHDANNSKVYLGGKIIEEFKNKLELKLKNLKDGEHSLKVIAYDLAENKVEESIKFTVDTKPPKTPSATVKEVNGNLELESSCEEESVLRILKFGTKVGEYTCQKGEKRRKIKVNNGVDVGKEYIFSVQNIDKLGNASEFKEVRFLKKESVKQNYETPINNIRLKCNGEIDYESKKLSLQNCSFPDYNSSNILSVKGQYDNIYRVYYTYPREIDLTIQVKMCKVKTVWDPRTWFGCVKEVKSEIKVARLIFNKIDFNDKIKEEYVLEPLLYDHRENNVFSLDFGLKKYISNLPYTFSAYIGGAIEYNKEFYPLYNYGISSNSELNIKDNILRDATASNNPKYFAWIFKGYREVSQWYGNTVYQKPHGGIDFSVYKDKFYSPADGIVVSAKYSRMDKCNEGGYYIGIKHTNGMYSYYFHLDEMNVKQNDKVKKGDYLGKTGNSGMYKCNSLAYHLHFELRKGQESSTHVNPVSYIDVDWSKIKTAKADIYPGRLSGDNPHPKF